MASNQALQEVSDESEISETSEDEDSKVNSDSDTEKIIAGLDFDQDEILFHAIENLTPTIVKYLLKKGCNLNARYSTHADVENESEKNTPLMKAFEINRMDIAKVLLKYGAEIGPALQHAASTGKLEIIEFLSKCNADEEDINDEKCTPLHLVVKNDSLEESDQLKAIKILLENGANANAIDSKSNTALHYAVENSEEKIIELLLKYDIDIDVIDGYQQCALHQAVDNEDVEVVELLLKNGANINLKDMELDTALHLASESGNTEIVELLLKYDIDIDAVNNTFRSALQIASEKNNTEVVKTLLINGAKANLANGTFFTMFSISTNEIRRYFFDYAINLDMNIRNNDTNTVFEEDIFLLDITSAKKLLINQLQAITFTFSCF